MATNAAMDLTARGPSPATCGSRSSSDANAATLASSSSTKALTAAGYKKDAKGNRLGKDGKPLPTFKILVGAGWTDFITMATVIGQDLKKVGINTSIDQQAWSSYAGGLQTGSIWVNRYYNFLQGQAFGGYKQSGNGRELGPHALDEYTEEKFVHVDLARRIENKVYDLVVPRED